MFSEDNRQTFLKHNENSYPALVGGRALAARLIGKPILTGLTVALLSYWLVWSFLRFGLNFEFFRSDVAWYWNDSLGWQTPYNRVHVPGYPLLIAMLRFITLYRLPPLIIMGSISLASYLMGVWAVVKIFERTAGKKMALMSALLFALWPFVGVTYVVYPVADSLAICLFLLGLYHGLRKGYIWAGLFIGLAVITHKAIWPFAGLTAAAMLAIDGKNRRCWIGLAVMALPLLLLWGGGTYYHASPSWLFSKSIDVESVSRSSLPWLDGLIGTVVYQGGKGILKGLVLWGLLLLLLWLLKAAWINPAKDQRWFGIAVLVAALFLLVSLNQNTIWAAVRYSKLVGRLA